MKRIRDRDTPPRSKRRRSSKGRYDDSSDERITPNRIRLRGCRGRSPSAGSRYISPHRDEYYRPAQPDRAYPYKVLCINALHPKASDEVITDTLYREYKKYGNLSVRITHDMDERLAYVCFRNPEDARDAKHGKPRIIIYDKVALVEPVYEVPWSSSSTHRGRARSISPEYDNHYYGRSPDRLRPVDSYERAYGHASPGDLIHHELALPALYHDYLRRPLAQHSSPHMARGYAPPRNAARRVPQDKAENKKDGKYPNYLQHVQPEDDPLATRTLFAGNLEVNITEVELFRIFSRFGAVEDIDIKRPPPGTGNAFAFVKFYTLDMAHCAKVELSGQYIGKFQCKIGYGKASPTNRIWVGGLGPRTSITQLKTEFERFGAIKKIDYTNGDIQAYLTYDTIEAGQAAVKEMRGFPLGGLEHRLRTDFAELNSNAAFMPKQYLPNEAAIEGYRRPPEDYVVAYNEEGRNHDYGRYRGRAPYPEKRMGSGSSYRFHEGDCTRPTDDDYNRHRSGSRGGVQSRSRSPRQSMDNDSDNESRRADLLQSSRTLPEVARKSLKASHRALILKNSLFPAKFHLIEGDTDIVEDLMKGEDGKHHLRITQRLRLDQPKLEDVRKRISSATSFAIFLGLAGSTSLVTNDDPKVQTRPFRNLVSYLKQKEAAGVISLLNKETEMTGVLYSFPPSLFSTELLKRTCHNLPDDAFKEDHLIIVVVRGGLA